MNADTRKIVQALCYIGSKCRNRTINKIPALKIVYLADRYHLRKFGTSITGDEYYAMEKGPVPSVTKSIMEGRAEGPSEEYAKRYIVSGRNSFCAKIATNFDELSRTDIEALDAAYDTYRDHCEDIVTFTHRFQEWKRHQSLLDSGARKRVRMSIADFFEPSLFERDEYCPAPQKVVDMNRDNYLSTPEYMRV